MAGRTRPVRIVGDPVLHQRTELVQVFDGALSDLVEDMFATMYLAEGVGLAATQIGVALAVFVYDCPDADDVVHRGHVINPVIASSSVEIDDSEEGCLSVPGPYASLARPASVRVTGVDKTGAPIEVSGNGLLARCLVHETEHLQGILYIDHLNRRRRSRVLQAVEPFSWNAEPTSP
jgi:peptide deformylase